MCLIFISNNILGICYIFCVKSLLLVIIELRYLELIFEFLVDFELLFELDLQ